MKNHYFNTLFLLVAGMFLVNQSCSVAQKGTLTSKTALASDGYTVMNPQEAIKIYKYEQLGHSAKEADKYEPKYYFTTASSDDLIILNKTNLKQAFSTNHPYHDAIDANFNKDEELIKYDDFHKMYKINRLLLKDNDSKNMKSDSSNPMYRDSSNKNWDSSKNMNRDSLKHKNWDNSNKNWDNSNNMNRDSSNKNWDSSKNMHRDSLNKNWDNSNKNWDSSNNMNRDSSKHKNWDNSNMNWDNSKNMNRDSSQHKNWDNSNKNWDNSNKNWDNSNKNWDNSKTMNRDSLKHKNWDNSKKNWDSSNNMNRDSSNKNWDSSKNMNRDSLNHKNWDNSNKNWDSSKNMNRDSLNHKNWDNSNKNWDNSKKNWDSSKNMNRHSNHMNMDSSMRSAMKNAMDKMHNMKMSADFDHDFAHMMIIHHQAAIDMSQIVMVKGTDAQVKKMAQNIITEQKAEINQMELFIKNHKVTASGKHHEMGESMNSMMEKMSSIQMTGNIDKDYVMMMIPHHECAVSMAEAELAHGKQIELKKIAQNIISGQKNEITEFKSWKSIQK